MELILLTAAGVGGATLVGAIIGFVFKGISHKFSDIVLSFAAGVMLAAAVLGLVLAAVYDLLRGIRRLRPGCTGLMDFVFGLLLLTGLLWFML